MNEQPPSVAATLGPSSKPDPGDPAEAPILPAWFYWWLLVSWPLLLVAPTGPFLYLFIAVACCYYAASFLGQVERTVLLFVVLTPTVGLAPWIFRLLPAMNFDTFAILSLAAAAVICKGRQTQPAPPNPLIAPVVFLVSLMTFGAGWSFFTGAAQTHSWVGGWETMDSYLLFSKLKNICLVMFLGPIAFRLLRSADHLKHAIYLIAWSTSLVAMEAMWAMWHVIVTGSAGPAFRAETFVYDEPNRLGGFLTLMVIIFASLALAGKLSLNQRVVYTGTLVLAGAALLFTFSRTAWAGAFAGLTFLGVTRGARLMVVLLVVALTASYWIPESVFKRVDDTFRESSTPMDDGVELEGSAEGRIKQWSNMPRMFIRAPLIGNGFWSFPRLFGVITDSGAARAAHSSIIRMTVEHGLAGIAAYLWLLWTMASGARRVKARSSDPVLVALAPGMVAALVALMVMDCAHNHFYSSSVMWYVWILGGGIVRMAWIVSQQPKPQRIVAAPRSGAR